jgi:hypothetical protein
LICITKHTQGAAMLSKSLVAGLFIGAGSAQALKRISNLRQVPAPQVRLAFPLQLIVVMEME